MNTHSLTTTDLKQQVHQIVEQLPLEQLPALLHFSEGLLHPTHVILGGKDSAFTPSNLPTPTEHPWLKFAGMSQDDQDWEEFQAAIAEYRREVDAIHGER
jgi:hypothetical protein